MRTALRTWLLGRGGVLALATLALYVVIAPHHVVDGDNAEFATLSVTGGAAHPSGYPLYVMWLRVMSWLPGVSPAHTAAIATSILGAAGVLVLHAACRAWGARELSATLAVGVFATGPVVLRVVTEAEVFALNNLVVATVLWLAATRGPLRGARRAFALGVVAGLGLANNLTCVLVAPIGLVGLLRAGRERAGDSSTIVVHMVVVSGQAMVGLLVGIAPYAYLLAAPDTPLSWGAVRSGGRLLSMVMRDDYGGPTAFRPGAPSVPPLDNLFALVKTVGRGWLYLPAITGLGVLMRRCVRARDDAEPRAGWIALAISWLVAGPLLVLRFNVAPEGLGLYVNQRFHLLPLLLLAPAVAIAFDIVASRVPARRTSIAVALVATVGLAGLAVPSLGYVGRVHSQAVETGARNLLRSLPPDAVVIHGQDELHFVPGYLQWAMGERRDVGVVMWTLMSLPWYRERAAARGIISGPGAGTPKERLVANLLARGRPVFVDRLQRDIIGAFPTYPHGVLMRVLPRGAATPSVIEVLALNESLFAKFALDYPPPGPDDEFATEVHARYAYTWELIAKALEAQGYTAQAARAHMHATKLAPH